MERIPFIGSPCRGLGWVAPVGACALRRFVLSVLARQFFGPVACCEVASVRGVANRRAEEFGKEGRRRVGASAAS